MVVFPSTPQNPSSSSSSSRTKLEFVCLFVCLSSLAFLNWLSMVPGPLTPPGQFFLGGVSDGVSHRHGDESLFPTII